MIEKEGIDFDAVVDAEDEKLFTRLESLAEGLRKDGNEEEALLVEYQMDLLVEAWADHRKVDWEEVFRGTGKYYIFNQNHPWTKEDGEV